MAESKILGKIKTSQLPLLDSTLELAIFDEILSLMFQRNETELTDNQLNVLLTFIYDSEVLNGGHLQYFQNQGSENIRRILDFLPTIGAECQKEILTKVFEKSQELPEVAAETFEQFHERVMKGEFFNFDMAYYKCSPEIVGELLPQYVNQNLSAFVEIE